MGQAQVEDRGVLQDGQEPLRAGSVRSGHAAGGVSVPGAFALGVRAVAVGRVEHATPAGVWPNWREIASALRRMLLPEVVQAELLAELERLRPFLEAAGVPMGT